MRGDGKPFLPYGRHTVDAADAAAIQEVLDSDFLTTGPMPAKLEAAFSETVEAGHAVVCNSGTAALHLAMLALGVGEGDSVVVPSITFLSTANAARFVGADVVFADVDPVSGLMTAQTYAAALEGHSNVKAAIPVHLGGQCVDMAALKAIAPEIPLVEDACHAVGTRTADGMVGNCAHSVMACFSLHPVKTIAMGEGGLVTTNDPALADVMQIFRSHGMVRDPERFEDNSKAGQPWAYEMQALGHNFRASDIQCALGLSQLGKLEGFAARRRELVALYDEKLAGFSPVLRPVSRMPGQTPAWHLYQVLIDFDQAGLSRLQVVNALKEHGIGTQVHYIPVHTQPYYKALYGGQSLPGAEAFYARTLTLPLFPAMADRDVDRVVDALSEILGGG